MIKKIYTHKWEKDGPHSNFYFKLPIAADWTIRQKKSTNPDTNRQARSAETLTTFTPCSLPMVVGGQS